MIRYRAVNIAAMLAVLMMVASGLTVNQPAMAKQASPAMSLRPGSAAPGATVQVEGKHFPAATKGQLVLQPGAAVLATFATQRAGAFAATFVIPAVPPGAYTVVATVARSSAQQPLQVTAGTTAPPPATARVAPPGPTATLPPEPTATAFPPTATLAPRTSTATPTATVPAPTVTPASTVLSFAAAADARVEAAHPNAAYGRDPALLTDGEPELESYLQFHVTGVTGRVEQASLWLYAYDGSIDGPATYGTGATWNERDLTWATRPARTSAAVADAGRVQADGWLVIDVTTLVTADGSYSFLLAPTSSDGVDFYSREAGTNPPRLELTVGAGTPQAPPTAIAPPPPTATPLPLTATLAPPTATVPAPTATRAAPTSTTVPTTTATARAGTGQTITIAAAGDIACDPNSGGFNGGDGNSNSCHGKYTAQLIDAMGADAVLGLGDFQYEQATLANMAASYDLSWGRFKGITYPTAGTSHDFNGGGDYYRYWGSQAGPSPQQTWYSVELGEWHVISLNSSCDAAIVGGCGPGSAQYEWLKRDLASSTAPCTLAFWHVPRYSSGTRHGSNTATDPLWDLLYENGAELVLSGHDHHYERFAPVDAADTQDPAFGIRSFLIGTGGKYLYEPGPAIANSEARSGSAFGVIKMVLRPDGYDWQFVPEAGATFTDSGSGVCHGKPGGTALSDGSDTNRVVGAGLVTSAGQDPLMPRVADMPRMLLIILMVSAAFLQLGRWASTQGALKGATLAITKAWSCLNANKSHGRDK